jgi:hypothetical protein
MSLNLVSSENTNIVIHWIVRLTFVVCAGIPFTDPLADGPTIQYANSVSNYFVLSQAPLILLPPTPSPSNFALVIHPPGITKA